MKKFFSSLVFCLFLVSLSGCGGAQQPAEPATPPAEAGQTRHLTLVDGVGTETLWLAGEEAGEVFTLNTAELPVFLDEEKADPSALLDGQTLEVTFDGIRESFPQQLDGVKSVKAWSIGQPQQPSGTYFDLCGLYLQVLEDLWNTDEALNENAQYICVDLSQAPGNLTKGQQAAMAEIFAQKHGAKALSLTFKELGEEGYLGEGQASKDGSPLYLDGFSDGLFFSISPAAGREPFSLRPGVFFRAQKYKGPMAADFCEDCSAFWPKNGSWADKAPSGYTVGAYGIS